MIQFFLFMIDRRRILSHCITDKLFIVKSSWFHSVCSPRRSVLDLSMLRRWSATLGRQQKTLAQVIIPLCCIHFGFQTFRGKTGMPVPLCSRAWKNQNWRKKKSERSFMRTERNIPRRLLIQVNANWTCSLHEHWFFFFLDPHLFRPPLW